MAGSSLKYREDIDGLRALAVAIVILFHFQVSSVPGGFVGVDVFFVISGFLITSLISRQIADGHFNLIDFYERRFRRIYPNLLVVLTATVVLGFLAMMPLTYHPFGRHLIWATLSVSNFAFIGGNGYFDPDNLTKPLLHTWSLGVEEQFYLVFPWLLILASKRGYNAKWLVGIIIGLSLTLSVGAAFADWTPSYFLLPTRFWELGIGALIAILPTSSRLSTVHRSVLGIAGLLAIGWAALRLTESDPFPGYFAMVPTLGAAAIIWANGGVAARVLSFRPFVWIGRMSYALYLWHWPLISIAAGIGLPPTNSGSRIVIIAIMFGLSVAGYFLWEQPIRRRRLLRSRKLFFAVLAVFAVALIGAGLVIFQTRGVPQRLPADLVAMEKAAKNDSFYINKRCPALTKGDLVSCPLGDEARAAITFAILGDSHAQAVAAEIGDLAKSYHLRGVFLGRAGCPPLAGLTRTAHSSCTDQYDFAISQIKELQPDLVIVIAQWAAVTGDPDGGYKTSLFAKSGPIPESDRLSMVSSALQKTISDIGDRQIVTAQTVPEYNGMAPIAWQRWAERLGLSRINTSLSVNAYWNRQEYAKSMLDKISKNNKYIHIVDTTKVLCNTNDCIRAIEGVFLYSDHTHLSHVGAKIYAAQFEPYFAALTDKGQSAR